MTIKSIGVVAQNAFAHNPDPMGYLTRLKPLLADNGYVFIQTSQSEMVQNGEFDTIYHEHVNFYNINSMQKLCERAGLFLCDVVKTPVHGNSYVFVVSATQSRPQHIYNLKQLEKELYTPDIYSVWAERAKQIAQQYDKAIMALGNIGVKVNSMTQQARILKTQRFQTFEILNRLRDLIEKLLNLYKNNKDTLQLVYNDITTATTKAGAEQESLLEQLANELRQSLADPTTEQQFIELKKIKKIFFKTVVSKRLLINILDKKQQLVYLG